MKSPLATHPMRINVFLGEKEIQRRIIPGRYVPLMRDAEASKKDLKMYCSRRILMDANQHKKWSYEKGMRAKELDKAISVSSPSSFFLRTPCDDAAAPFLSSTFPGIARCLQ